MDSAGKFAIPLAGWAQAQLDAAGALAGVPMPDAATLLGERAVLNGWCVPGRVSAGGGCRLLDAADGHVALNLARADDRGLLAALFEDAAVVGDELGAIAGRLAIASARAIVARGRELGLALAALDERPVSPACVATAESPPKPPSPRPLVIDLAALWAGPLAANLLGLAGAEVIKVESRSRPDALREGDPALFARLNGGKDSITLDLREPRQREALVALLQCADVVIEAARPRALMQLGIDADALVRATPGLVWVSITGHGIAGAAANWTGFGDDCGVAGGLSAALLAATGSLGFVGDAIADPLAGIAAARAALEQRASGAGARLVLSMAAVAAEALAAERERDAAGLDRSLAAWADVRGRPFPPVAARATGPVRPFGADNGVWLEGWCTC